MPKKMWCAAKEHKENVTINKSTSFFHTQTFSFNHSHPEYTKNSHQRSKNCRNVQAKLIVTVSFHRKYRKRLETNNELSLMINNHSQLVHHISSNSRKSHMRHGEYVFLAHPISFFLVKPFKTLWMKTSHSMRHYMTSWWFQPIWRILVNLEIISPGRGENKKIFETTI